MSLQNCSNCYNGCTEIVSDKCVRYTGIDVPVLGIQNGDSLSYVEQALITFLTSALDGTGIKLTIPLDTICVVVEKYLPICEDLSALNLFKALIAATCDLQEQIKVNSIAIADLNSNYSIGCLDVVTNDSDTHEVLQQVIIKLCAVDAGLTALALDVDTNYVKLADLDALIQSYLDGLSPIAQQYVKMVPYTVVEYYGSLSNFSGSGAGIAGLGWDKIYLCNGKNGTPDKRGRIPVGAIQGIPGGDPLDPPVDPTNPGNPNYALNTIAGANTVILTTPQIPSHTHTTAVNVIDPKHSHFTVINQQLGVGSAAPTPLTSMVNSYANGSASQNYDLKGNAVVPDTSLTNLQSTGISVNVVNNPAGNSQSHNNIPPVLACYYIMYIPS
jgi:microcystin-dependent protein